MVAILLIALGTCGAAQSAARGDLYVSLSGNDGWSGTLPAPNARQTDGPFATVERARLAVRELRQRGGCTGPITVFLRGGVYYLRDPLVFEPDDSGTRESPVTYSAYRGEITVLSGGQVLSGWTRDARGWWRTRLPDAGPGEWSFLSIYVNGERRRRTRLPRNGYYRIHTDIPCEARPDRLAFRPGDIRADWANLSDVEVLTLHLWNMSRMRVKSVDLSEGVVGFTGATCSDAEYGGFRSGYPYLVENVAEALGEPGEWYLDRSGGELTYVPMKGESPGSSEVIAPRLGTLLELRGDWRSGRYVSGIIFRGLAFEHSNWVTPEQGYHFPQCDGTLPPAIFAEGSRDCRWEQCSVRRTGAYAIGLGAGCKRNVIEDCELTDLGAGGVSLGFWSPREPWDAQNSHNTVSNCLIAHGGRVMPGGTGILIGSHHNLVRNNEICDFYYDAIAAGYTWDRTVSAHHNTIENNHIHGIGQAVLSDMGAIYTLGDSPGTVIRHNLIHDVESSLYGGWGVYFDAQSSNILVRDNIICRTDGGAIHQVRGAANRVTNNIFAYSAEQQLMCSPSPGLGLELDRNIILWRDSFPLGGDWCEPGLDLDRNLYWDASRGPVRFGTLTFEQWQGKGRDLHSLIADPLFADPENDDFTLSPDSPAFALGFEPISASSFGRRSFTRKPIRFAPRAFPALRDPLPLKYGFEDLPVGARPSCGAVSERVRGGSIYITGDAAASGTRSLKFVDDGSHEQPWEPMLVYGHKRASGTMVGRFAVRVEPGACFRHEWRDTVVMDRPGPSLLIDTSANLFANGVRLGEVPTGEWLLFEITCTLGARSRGEYSLKVVSRVDPPRVYRGLKHSPEFHRLMWVGFIADGTDPGVFYLDDIDFGPK